MMTREEKQNSGRARIPAVVGKASAVIDTFRASNVKVYGISIQRGCSGVMSKPMKIGVKYCDVNSSGVKSVRVFPVFCGFHTIENDEIFYGSLNELKGKFTGMKFY